MLRDVPPSISDGMGREGEERGNLLAHLLPDKAVKVNMRGISLNCTPISSTQVIKKSNASSHLVTLNLQISLGLELCHIELSRCVSMRGVPKNCDRLIWVF